MEEGGRGGGGSPGRCWLEENERDRDVCVIFFGVLFSMLLLNHERKVPGSASKIYRIQGLARSLTFTKIM